MTSTDSEVLAQQVSALKESVAGIERRMAEVEKVNARLELAAISTARAMEEISRHWDAVYEAMRRAETGQSENRAPERRGGASGRRDGELLTAAHAAKDNPGGPS